jgi:hypothetical protein
MKGSKIDSLSDKIFMGLSLYPFSILYMVKVRVGLGLGLGLESGFHRALSLSLRHLIWLAFL